VKGQVNQTWNDAAIANPVVTGNTLVVTAQDGTTIVTYTITVNAAPNNGGGGFIPQPVITPEPEPDPEPVPGATDVKGAIDQAGTFTETVTIVTEDQAVVIDIPAGTVGLDADLQPLAAIIMVPLEEPPAPPPAGTIAFLYDLGPDGATFEPAITLSMPLPEGADPSTATIAYWDGSEWIILETTYDPETGRLTAQTTHFTVFGTLILEPEPAAAEPESSVEPAPTTPSAPVTETAKPAPAEPSSQIQPTEIAPNISKNPTETAPNKSENPIIIDESKRSFAWYWWLIISIGTAVILTTGWIEWRRGVISRKISGK
jgi:hypothetical protein